MKTTNNPITNKTALHLNRLIFGVHFLLSIAAMLVLIAHPCRAVRTHTHRYQVISTNCKTGVQRLKCRCGKKKKVHKKKGHRFRKAKDGYFTVSKCQNCGKIAKKYLNNDIPTYWNENVSIAIKTAKTHGNLPGYVFLTDPHWGRNAKNSPAIVSFVTKQMGYSYAVCGGDVVTGCHENKQDAVAEIEEFYSCFQVPVLSIEGNHDSNRKALRKTLCKRYSTKTALMLRFGTFCALISLGHPTSSRGRQYARP